MLVTAVPRKLICVRGFAVSVPGAGETFSGVPSRAALWSSEVGRHTGDGPLGGTLVCAPEKLPVPSTMATVIQATAATARTMYPFLLIDNGNRPRSMTGSARAGGAASEQASRPLLGRPGS